MTREEYRKQMEEKANRKAVTKAEFDEMPTSKQLAYAIRQKKLGLPVTLEEKSYYDEAEYKSRYNKQTVVANKAEKVGGLVDLAALASKVDLALSFCHFAK